jgi:hypothetical protein
VLGYAYEFFDTNQARDCSLGLPSWDRLLFTHAAPCGWNKPGHWNDGGSGRDLSGGYDDAGDNRKCPHVLACWGVSNLIMFLSEFSPRTTRAAVLKCTWRTRVRQASQLVPSPAAAAPRVCVWCVWVEISAVTCIM